MFGSELACWDDIGMPRVRLRMFRSFFILCWHDRQHKSAPFFEMMSVQMLSGSRCEMPVKACTDFRTSLPAFRSVQRRHGNRSLSFQVLPNVCLSLSFFRIAFQLALACCGVMSFRSTCRNMCGPGCTPCRNNMGLYGCASRSLSPSRMRLLMM